MPGSDSRVPTLRRHTIDRRSGQDGLPRWSIKAINLKGCPFECCKFKIWECRPIYKLLPPVFKQGAIIRPAMRICWHGSRTMLHVSTTLNGSDGPMVLSVLNARRLAIGGWVTGGSGASHANAVSRSLLEPSSTAHVLPSRSGLLPRGI